MLNHNPFSCQTPIVLFFSFCQSMTFGFLEGCLTVLMKFHQTLIASICQNSKMFRELTGVLFEQLEVVFASITKCRGYDLSTFSIRHHLRFLSVTLLFAAVMPFLAFFPGTARQGRCGRSSDCSQTSTSTISNTVSLGLECLLARQTKLY